MEAPAGRITLNVGGLRFQTCRGTLGAFPGTKLGGLAEPQAAARFDYDAAAGEFFFDRSGRLFGHVLHLCRSGHLPCPAAVCRGALQAELDFWGLSEARLPACCWRKLCGAEGPGEARDLGGPGEQDDRRGLLEPEAEQRARRPAGGPWARWKRAAWTLLEKPYSSRWALGLTATSLLFSVAVIVILCVKGSQYNITHPHLHHVSEASACPQVPSLLHLELFFVVCFMCEFAIRLASCPDKRKFFRKPLNVVDFLALFPVCLDLFFSGPRHKPGALPCWLNLFRVVYIVKLLKVFKLVETPLMLRVFPYMFKSILKEVAILMWVFIFEILFFGTLLFFAELMQDHSESLFHGIFSSFWWAVVTLTTIGYGDMFPIYTASKVVGACTALCGILTIITPIPILYVKFKGYYGAIMIKEKEKREKREGPTLPS